MDNFLCNYCGIIFTAKRNLQRHQKNFHSLETAYKTEANLSCAFCNEVFRHRSSLHRHISNFHSHPDPSILPQSSHKPYTPLPPSALPATSMSFQQLTKHITPPNSFTSLSSPITPVSLTPSQESKHVTHTSSTTFPSPISPATFTSSQQLTKHFTPEKPSTSLSAPIPHIPFLHKPSTSSHVSPNCLLGTSFPVAVAKNKKASRILCPVQCQEYFTKYDTFHRHLMQNHNINVEMEQHLFESMRDFEHWKKNIEQITTSLYVKQNSGKVNQDGCKVIYYNCHRSYYYKQNCTKRVFTKTNKTGYACPSRICVTVFNNGHTQIIYWKTHVGHSQLLRTIPTH